MGQNYAECPPGFPKMTKTFFITPEIEATANPLIEFTAEQGQTPLSLRFNAQALERTDGNETYVISLYDDGTKISTDNAAGLLPDTKYEAYFAASTHIAKDSAMKIVLTLGGTTPAISGITIEYTYLEG
jgi:hypothetical protein